MFSFRSNQRHADGAAYLYRAGLRGQTLFGWKRLPVDQKQIRGRKRDARFRQQIDRYALIRVQGLDLLPIYDCDRGWGCLL